LVLRLAADENFNNDIVRALRRHKPDIDIVSVQDTGLRGADDPTILAWAASEGRVLFTHDVSTMSDFAYDRINRGELMPGVFAISREVAIRQAIEDILLLVECSHEGEWDGQVNYLPL
jgi:predicted nuclease of predicted toxin-antitoxin system